MTRFIYDDFAKQYLEELLKNFGSVELNKNVSSEVQFIDVFFTPSAEKKLELNQLGLLGKITQKESLIEPYHNPVTKQEIRECLNKLFLVYGDINRRSKRNETKVIEEDLPYLWIITPTLSRKIINIFRLLKEPKKWGEGIYLSGEGLNTGIIVVHQLPKNEETLWLRLLGRGKVKQQAIMELKELPLDNNFKSAALELVYNLLTILESRQGQNQPKFSEDKELIMRLSPEYLERLESATQKGVQKGLEQGLEQGFQQGFQQTLTERRLMVETLLIFRFGEIDQKLSNIIEPLIQISAAESTSLLISLSKEELLSRFNS